MSGSVDQGKNLDRTAIEAQIAALAEHLQRVGVHWLPQADPEHVASLQQRMAPIGSGDSSLSTDVVLDRETGAGRPTEPGRSSQLPSSDAPQDAAAT